MLIRAGGGTTGFSTSFLGSERGRAERIVEAAKSLDVNRVELAAELDCDPPEKLESLFRKEGIRVLSLHNVLSSGGGEESFLRGDTLADTRPAAVEEGLRLTLETARRARLLGAPFVVLHGGACPGEEVRGIGKEIALLFEREGLSGKVRDLVEKGRALMAPLRDRLLDRLVRSLHALMKAEPETIFCLETRYNFFEFPDIESMEYVFEDLDGPGLMYWHDTGHAHAQEVLGLAAQGEWLDRFGPRLAGVHLHDAAGLADHLPPGAGEIDFRPVREALPAEAVRIMEIGPGRGLDEARMGLEELKRMGF